MDNTYTLSIDFEYDKITASNIVGYGIPLNAEEDSRELISYVRGIIDRSIKASGGVLVKTYFTLFKNSDTVLLETNPTTMTTYPQIVEFVSNVIEKIKEDKEQFLIEEIETDETTE